MIIFFFVGVVGDVLFCYYYLCIDGQCVYCVFVGYGVFVLLIFGWLQIWYVWCYVL